MKLLLLFAFIAACTASPSVPPRTVSVEDDGSYLINNSLSGRRIQLFKPTLFRGQQVYEVQVSGPNIVPSVIRIYGIYQNEVEQPKLGFPKFTPEGNTDGLFLILREFVGPITDSQWDKLLTRVQTAVRQGVIVPEIYELLAGLDFIEANYFWLAIQNGEQLFGQFHQDRSLYSPVFGFSGYQTPYQGQYYLNSQYQGPYSSQYYQGLYTNNDVNQQYIYAVPNSYPALVEYYSQQPQNYYGQYLQKYYAQQQAQNLEQYYGQYLRPSNQQYYGQKQPFYNQQQQYYSQYSPYRQQYNSYPYQSYQVPQAVY